MQWRNGPIFLLTSAIPKLKSDIHLIDHSILKCKIVANSCHCVLFILLAFQTIDQGCLANLAFPNKAHLDKLIDIFHDFLFLKHLQKRMVDVRFSLVDNYLTDWT
jgi:hypothetical protein